MTPTLTRATHSTFDTTTQRFVRTGPHWSHPPSHYSLSCVNGTCPTKSERRGIRCSEAELSPSPAIHRARRYCPIRLFRPNIDPSSCSILKKENSRNITRSTTRVLHLDLVTGQVVPSFHKQRQPISLLLRLTQQCKYSLRCFPLAIIHLTSSFTILRIAFPKTLIQSFGSRLFAQVRGLINQSVTIASSLILIKLRGWSRPCFDATFLESVSQTLSSALPTITLVTAYSSSSF